MFIIPQIFYYSTFETPGLEITTVFAISGWNRQNLHFLIYYITMANLQNNLNFSIVNSINEIPEQEWNRLFGDIIENYGYQKTLEESGVEGFLFAYLVGRKEGKITAILPFFIMDFSFDTIIEGPFHKLAHKFRRFLRVKSLFLGSPISEKFYMGISQEEDLKEAINKALEKLRKFCKDEKIAGIIFYNLAEKDKPLAGHLAKKNFIEMEGLPGTVIEIKHKSFDKYAESLSKNMRKDLRRKLRRATEQADLKTEVRSDILGISDQIFKLYLNNFDDSGIHFEMLKKGFFENICSNMEGVIKYFITYDKDKIVAFNLCLVKNGVMVDKYIGLDRELSHKYHLYFTTFAHNMQWCMDNGIHFYQPGNTDYYPKIRLGAKLIPLYLYVKAFNPLLNFVLKSLKSIIQPRNLDPSLKNIKWFEKDGKFIP